jgi:hypothetical protein
LGTKTKTKFVVSLGDNFLGLWPRVVGVTQLVCVFLFLFAMEFSICSHQKKKKKQTNKPKSKPEPKLVNKTWVEWWANQRLTGS